MQFDLFYAQHVGQVRAIATRRLRDPAVVEDAVQETFIALAGVLDRLDPDRDIDAYVAKVATNACNDALRKSRRLERQVSLAPLDIEAIESRTNVPQQHAPDPADAALAAQHRPVIAEALAEIHPAQRAVLVRHLVDGLSYRELQAETGASPDALRSSIKRARRTFRTVYVRVARERGLLGGTLVGRLVARGWERLHRALLRLSAWIDAAVLPVARTLEQVTFAAAAVAALALPATTYSTDGAGGGSAQGKHVTTDVGSSASFASAHPGSARLPTAHSSLTDAATATPTSVQRSLRTRDVLPGPVVVDGTGNARQDSPGGLVVRAYLEVAGVEVAEHEVRENEDSEPYDNRRGCNGGVTTSAACLAVNVAAPALAASGGSRYGTS